MYLKYVLYTGISSLGSETNAKNCVDSLTPSGNTFYFAKINIGSDFFLIAQAHNSTHKSYISFGYYYDLSYQSKTSGVWGPLKTLA
jgi:hypothetical protein